jgi:hypothetical protein
MALIGDVAYDADGDFLLARPGTVTRTVYEEKMGRLASHPFVLGGNGYVTFMLRRPRSRPDAHFLQTRQRWAEIGRYGNSSFDVSSGILSYYGENLVTYRADLSPYIGQSLYVELNDYGGHDWDYLTFDYVETYHDSIPKGLTPSTFGQRF